MKNYSPKNTHNNSGHQVGVAQQVSITGPLPLAQQFEQYEKVLPGAAERIIKQAEKEQENRFLNDVRINESNTAIIKNNHFEKILGMTIGGVLCSLIIAVGAVMVFKGHDWAGAGIMSATLVGIGTVFVTGKKYEK